MTGQNGDIKYECFGTSNGTFDPLLTDPKVSLEKSNGKRESSTSSASSIHSDSSTGRLIKSLSTDKDKPESPEVPQVQTHTIHMPKNNVKPVKFSVRKVSQEPATIRDVSDSSFRSNTSENSSNQRYEEQLQASQIKYDQYVNRINKINKEIDFLAKLLPPYNVEIDFTTRSKITTAIEKLKAKRDELDKRKYSLGVAISRLARDNEMSEIWVRGLTS